MAQQNYNIGDKYNMLTIKKKVRVSIGKKGRIIWGVICDCDCGGTIQTTITRLRDGTTNSCGCKTREKLITHGMNKSKEYFVWSSMKARCLNSNNYYDHDLYFSPLPYESFRVAFRLSLPWLKLWQTGFNNAHKNRSCCALRSFNMLRCYSLLFYLPFQKF